MEEAKQMNAEVRAAAAEEAQGKGSVDGRMEVQEVRESSGPLRRSRSLELTGDGVDAAHLVTLLRKKFGNAKLISTGPVKEPMKDIMEDESVLIKEEENEPELQPPVSSSSPHRLHPISESAGDPAETRELNGVMEMETQTMTHSNPSLENAERSRKTKTILEWTLIITSLLLEMETVEWTLQITSVVLEATSAIFEQLGYPLPSMVMAFVALLLFILDLINKARGKEGTTCDWRSLLPCFYRHHFRKPFGVVEYFGFAAAVWQCFQTTVGYHYSRQNLDNPIKMCPLPFIFALCVLIHKAVKSSQHDPLVGLNPHER